MLDAITQKWIRNKADEQAVDAGCRFDESRGQHVLDFARKYIRLYEGDLAGTLLEPMDWQVECTMRMFGWVKYSEKWKREVRRFRQASIWVPKKNGKALALDTPIPTPWGWTTIGKLRPGDALMDENGLPCRVTHTHPIECDDDTYEMEFSNGERIVCNGDHLWETTVLQHSTAGSTGKAFGGNQYTGSLNKRFKKTSVRTTREIESSLCRGDGARNHSIKLQKPLDLPECQLPIDPYVLGCWLGDGDSDAARITSSLDDFKRYWVEFLRSGYDCSLGKDNSSGAVRFKFQNQATTVPMRTIFKRLNLFKNKHIPAKYLRASIKQRLALLQGLMDTDGTISSNGKCLQFCSKLPTLAAAFGELLSSLGIKYRMTIKRPTISGRERAYHYIQFHAFKEQLAVFRLPRKLNRMRSTSALTMKARSGTVQIVDIRRIPPQAVRCITVDNPTGMFLCGGTMIPTHNSPTLAWWGLYLLCGDGERGQKVYLAAKDGSQAAEIAGKHAIEMVKASPYLDEKCRINQTTKQITHLSSKSIIKPISSNDARSQKSKEGLNGCVLVDETHVVDREFMGRVSRAGISRSEPLQIEVSTAGDDPMSYGRERYDYGKRINETGGNESLLFIAYEADQEIPDEVLADDPVKAGQEANPAWGMTIDPAEYLADYQTSRQSLSEFARFKMYRLNIWQRSSNPWLRMTDWTQCQRAYTDRDLIGLPCWAGLDLSKTRDLTALAFLFPIGDRFRLWLDFFMPEETARELDHKISFLQWAKDGWITLTPGGTLDYGFVRKRFAERAEQFKIREFAFDPWHAEETTQAMEQGVVIGGEEIERGTGVRRIEFRQNLANFAGPTDEFEKWVIDGKIEHPGNPVLNWQAGHVQVYCDANRNKRPIKPKHGDIKTIDGIVAAIMATALVLKNGGVSVYESRGVRTVGAIPMPEPVKAEPQMAVANVQWGGNWDDGDDD